MTSYSKLNLNCFNMSTNKCSGKNKYVCTYELFFVFDKKTLERQIMNRVFFESEGEVTGSFLI